MGPKVGHHVTFHPTSSPDQGFSAALLVLLR
jgi:hypothetical protein